MALNRLECPKKNMKSRQMEIYEFIDKYVSERGYSPTIREIANGVHLASPSSVHKYVSRMLEMGILKGNSKSPRTLRVSDEKKYSDI